MTEMVTVKDLIKCLVRYELETVLAVAIWQVDDVFSRAKERNIAISQEQAEDIISRIDRRQDATLGITWDTIDAYLDDLISEEEIDNEEKNKM